MIKSKFLFFSSYLGYKNIYSQINLTNLFINENNFTNLISTNDIISHRKFNFRFYRKRRIFSKITRRIKFLRKKIFSRKFTLKFRTNKYFCKFKKPLNNKLKQKNIFYNLFRFNKINNKIKCNFIKLKGIKFKNYDLFKKDKVYKNVVFSKLKSKIYLKTEFNNLKIKNIKKIFKLLKKKKLKKSRKKILRLNKLKHFYFYNLKLHYKNNYIGKKNNDKINLKNKNLRLKYFFFKLKNEKKNKLFNNKYKIISKKKKKVQKLKKRFFFKSLFISNKFLDLNLKKNFFFKKPNISLKKYKNLKKLYIIYKFFKMKKNIHKKKKNIKKNFFFYKKKKKTINTINVYLKKYKFFFRLKKKFFFNLQKRKFKLNKNFFFCTKNYKIANKKIFVNKRIKNAKKNFFSFSFLMSHLSIKKYNFLKKRNEFIKEMKNYDKLVSETPETQSLTKAYFEEKYVEFKTKYINLIKDDEILFLEKKNFVGTKILNRNNIPFLEKHVHWVFQKKQELSARKKLGLKRLSLFSYDIKNDIKPKIELYKLKKKSVLKKKTLTL